MTELKKVARLISPMIAKEISSARINSHDRIIEKLDDLQFMTRSIINTPSLLTIELQILDRSLMGHLLAGEANRFFLASVVSRERSTQNQLKNASWQAIENYYAAYFGIHYLLRMTGLSITNIDSNAKHAILRSYYDMPTPSIPLPSGLYIMKFNGDSGVVTLTKNLTKKGGGSHLEAWRHWEDLVQKLIDITKIDIVEYARISMYLTEHLSFIRGSETRCNPPEIRGKINYQFKGGAWIFEKGSEKSVGVLQRLISLPSTNRTSTSATPESLIVNNRLIIDMAIAVFNLISDSYPKGIYRSLANKYSSYLHDV
ncbi:hypothetical protein HAP93_04375 [Acidithiobacillus ferriphilus]|uniref:hypothetical protein n=1 Tax=Acidithiobacillus ferriphilus TaxID=1689834 RepID=UPI001C06108C|nr:hypothetical protein [Acidithiobacillus ferriphilus]MBU2785008.1 hypothetical protein [Acidithiobacillus ferriphilus]